MPASAMETELTVNQQIIGLLEAATPDGAFTLAEVVSKVHRQLQKKDPDLLQEAYEEMFESWLVEYYGNVLRKRRGVFRNRFERGESAGTESTTYDRTVSVLSGEKSIFDTKMCVSDENTWKRLGDMMSEDHLYVANKYEQSGRRDLMFAEFHRVLARRVRGRRTEEVLKEEEIENIYRNEIRTIEAGGK